MKNNDKVKIIIVLAFLILVATTEAFSIVIDKIVAVVNNEVITQREVTRLLFPLFEKYKKEYTGKRLENKMLEAEDVVLTQLIDEKLILSEAKRQGIEATGKEIELRLKNVKNRFGTEKEFRGALAEQNISLTELRDSFKSDIIKSKLIHKVVGLKVIIAPSEVNRYYDEHIDEFMEPKKARVFNILIKNKPEEKGTALFLANKIKETIKSGGDFKELAKEYSEGPNAKEGGDLGTVKKGEMIEELDDAIFSLEIGEVSNVIESPLGYHIVKVTEKKPEKTTEFDIVKQDIEGLIFREKIDDKVKKWLKGLKRDAYISIK
jgi:peptidyl-prolyl cis-trans isomerase SurA